jgi:hypothetical protein
MFQAIVVEKIKTHILCSITFYKNHAVYDVMGESAVEPKKPQMTI